MTRSEVMAAIMNYHEVAVAKAIEEGEDPGSFDLPGARMYYEELTDWDLVEYYNFLKDQRLLPS